jgi:hypothetical protein
MKTKNSFHIALLFILILLVVSACLAGAPTPTPTPTPPPTPCTSKQPNMYDIPAQIREDYADWRYFTPLQALSLLTSRIERWSDYEDIVLDEKATYRIIVTLVAPDVHRAAFIMEAVHRGRSRDEIVAGINQVAEDKLNADQLRFLVTVTLKYSDPANLMAATDKIIIDPAELVMLDHHGKEISYATIEGPFQTSFDVVDGPFAAYITYPLYRDGSWCEAHVNILADTSVTLKLKYFKIGEKEFKDISWNINLSPLVNVALPALTPNPTTQAGAAVPYYLEPKTIPPTPNPGETNTLNLDNYWIDLSKFIWSKMSASNSR